LFEAKVYRNRDFKFKNFMLQQLPASDTSPLVVLCTCPNEEDALRLANSLVAERLAACVNILPGIRSIYRWKDQVESAQEILLLIKTTHERFAALRDRILVLHAYETPEIIALPVVAGLEKYLTWWQGQV
jgi:periplasmic divalent cation tolerance protein